jgi:hypothetical protein
LGEGKGAVRKYVDYNCTLGLGMYSNKVKSIAVGQSCRAQARYLYLDISMGVMHAGEIRQMNGDNEKKSLLIEVHGTVWSSYQTQQENNQSGAQIFFTSGAVVINIASQVKVDALAQ